MQDQAIQTFREMLDAFVFFHLGSDAAVRVEAREGRLRVFIDHRRVRPFQFEVEGPRLEAMAADPAAFEEFMLGHLVRSRRA